METIVYISPKQGIGHKASFLEGQEEEDVN